MQPAKITGTEIFKCFPIIILSIYKAEFRGLR